MLLDSDSIHVVSGVYQGLYTIKTKEIGVNAGASVLGAKTKMESDEQNRTNKGNKGEKRRKTGS
jgi:hypothetical protein